VVGFPAYVLAQGSGWTSGEMPILPSGVYVRICFCAHTFSLGIGFWPITGGVYLWGSSGGPGRKGAIFTNVWWKTG